MATLPAISTQRESAYVQVKSYSYEIEIMGTLVICVVPNLLKTNECFPSLGMQNLHSNTEGLMAQI